MLTLELACLPRCWSPHWDNAEAQPAALGDNKKLEVIYPQTKLLETPSPPISPSSSFLIHQQQAEPEGDKTGRLFLLCCRGGGRWWEVMEEGSESGDGGGLAGMWERNMRQSCSLKLTKRPLNLVCSWRCSNQTSPSVFGNSSSSYRLAC